MTEELNDKNKKDFSNSDKEKRILHHAEQYEVPRSMTKEDALKLLKSKIDYSKTNKRNLSEVYWIGSVAASLLLFFGIGYLFHKPMTNVIAEKGKHLEYRLPDGTEVSMNAESKITLQKNNFNRNRFVKLEGEAFFNVRKGSTFTISTLQAEIKILGTTFNVLSRENLFKVSCFTGKVMVSTKQESIILFPGESAILEKDQLSKFVDKTIKTAAEWRNGDFNFEYAPLNIVFDEIERQYNVTFVIGKMNNKFFTGSFTNKNLVDALDIVCIPMGLTYEIGSNSNIFIRERPK
jgi:transmembrane sensor